MENDCCVIANITQQMLVDVPGKLAKKSGDIDVVGRVDSVSDINAVLAQNPVDLPESCVGIMHDIHNLTLVGLGDDGRRVACFLDDGINDILRMIRTLWLPGLDARQ